MPFCLDASSKHLIFGIIFMALSHFSFPYTKSFNISSTSMANLGFWLARAKLLPASLPLLTLFLSFIKRYPLLSYDFLNLLIDKAKFKSNKQLVKAGFLFT